MLMSSGIATIVLFSIIFLVTNVLAIHAHGHFASPSREKTPGIGRPKPNPNSENRRQGFSSRLINPRGRQ